MSGYLNFTQYNTLAEDIRPTARIQLIQRILNAANVISSLASGIPIKWASSYKSFQVLKYTENQDPQDVTTAAAVSACNSILSEAESQLRASQDDMNTLATELDKIGVNGRIHYLEKMKYDLRNNTFPVYFLLYEQGWKVCLKILESGAMDSIMVIPQAEWNDIPQSQKVVYSYWKNIIPLVCSRVPTLGTDNDMWAIANDGDRLQLFKAVRVMNDHITISAILSDTNGNTRFVESAYTYAQLDAATNSFPWVFVQHTPAWSANGYLFDHADIIGQASASEYLGLPDPSDVIDELDSLNS